MKAGNKTLNRESFLSYLVFFRMLARQRLESAKEEWDVAQDQIERDHAELIIEQMTYRTIMCDALILHAADVWSHFGPSD